MTVFAPVSRLSEDEGGLAYAFYDRIEACAQQHRTDVAKTLGQVMAHELGHILLARTAHSSIGMMRGRWGQFEMELIAAGLLMFTKEQGAMSCNNFLKSRREVSKHFW